MSTFEDLAATLAELEDIPSRIAGEVAEGINELIQEEFVSGSDPYGNAWAPLRPSTVRRKGGDTRIMRQSDDLSSGTVARASSGAGIEISSLEYGGYHQGPTSNRVARPVLPDGGELPEAWQEVIEAATDKAFTKAMGR